MGACANGPSGRSAVVLFLSLVLASCVQPVHKVSRDESFMKQGGGRTAWRRVAVLPFGGDPVFRRTAAEWFAFRVRKHDLFEIVDPSLAEIELGKKGIVFGEAGASVEVAQRAGQLLGVDGVVFGSVDPRPPPARPGRREATASVVDTATGKVVATGVQSYREWGPYSADPVMAAVARVAADLVPVFYAAAGKVWTPPRQKETEGREHPGRDTTGMVR